MKKISLLLFLTTIICHTAKAHDSKILNNSEFEIGVGVGQANYTIDTVAHSILKWRDATSFDGYLGYKYNFSPELKMIVDLNLGFVFSGEMTDDDLQNSISKECMPNCTAVYSRTKTMQGGQIKLDLAMSREFYENNNNKVSVLFGGRYQRNMYDPKGIYQIKVDPPSGSFAITDDAYAQSSDFVTYGPTLGIAFERASEAQSFSATLNGFLAFRTTSHQGNWGYNWYIEGDFASSYGLDLKLSTGFKLSEKTWLNIYTKFEYLKGKGLNEKDDRWDDILDLLDELENMGFVVPKLNGKIKYLENYKASIGMSLSIK